MPAIAKVLLIFSLIVLLNRFKLDLGLSILVGTLCLGLWFGLSAGAALLVMAKSLTEPLTIMIILLVMLILYLNQLLEKSGGSKKMVYHFARLVKNFKVSLVSLPALIGLLPMPGGAYFSAPMVDQLTQDVDLTPERKTMINYWFRHIWEYWWPMYPGVIMALSLSGLPLKTFIPMQVIFTLVSLVAGYFILLRRLPPHPALEAAHGRDLKEELKAFLYHALPVIIILFFMGALSLCEPLWARGALKGGALTQYIPMFVGMVLAIIWIAGSERYGPGTLVKALLTKKILTLLFLVIAIMAYKKMLPECGAIARMNAEFQAYHIPLLPIVILLPFISGLVIAVAMGFVGASFPVVVSLTGHNPHFAAYISLAYASGYVGMMASPIHMCLVLTKDYFKALFGGIYRTLLPLCATIFLFALGWFAFLRWL
jgi:uncharacterized protein